MKDTTKNIDVHGELFEIPPDSRARHFGVVLLKYFNNVDTTPFFMIDSLELGANYPTMMRSPFTFQGIYMQILCYI